MGATLATTAAAAPAPGLARILQPASSDAIARAPVHGDKRCGVPTETGSPFSAWLPYAEAVQWARELAETYGRPYRVVRAEG